MRKQFRVAFLLSLLVAIAFAQVPSYVTGCGGSSATVSVVGAGNLTSTALVTGGGTQTIQTPSDSCTLTSAGLLTCIQGIFQAPASTNDALIIRATNGFRAFSIWVTGDANPTAYFNGQNLWYGPGGASTVDATIGRVGVGTLQINGNGGPGNLQTTGLYNLYNNITTVSNGIPAEYATVDLTAQSSAITSTALYTPAATGLFRVSYYAKVTTAGTTSILGGTTGLVLTFTDGTDSVAQTAFTMPEDNQAGTALSVGTGNTTNSTQAVTHGMATIFAKTGVAINYAFGYTSTGTTMQYELHIKLEAL